MTSSQRIVFLGIDAANPVLLREWARAGALPNLGRVERENTFGRTGEHRIEGLFVAAGPQVSAGELSRSVSVLDFAPTFCELLGVALPLAEGKPIRELLRKTSEAHCALMQ